VGGVWLGNDDNSPMRKVTGGNLPAQLWREVMEKAHSAPIAQFQQSDDALETGALNALIESVR
jgi:membrane peptidoglycan carboxypeptidase